jgi:hypothetical protein
MDMIQRLFYVWVCSRFLKLGRQSGMSKRFEKESTYASRALQAYVILIGKATNQQTIQYLQLCELMHYGKGPVLAHPLGKIMNWCEREGLPALTSLVVEKETGIPSTGLTTVTEHSFPAEQQRVFSFDWFSIFLPTLQELTE